MSLRIVARGAFATGKVCLLATSPTGSAGSSAAGSACGSSFWSPSWALTLSFAASSVFRFFLFLLLVRFFFLDGLFFRLGGFFLRLHLTGRCARFGLVLLLYFFRPGCVRLLLRRHGEARPLITDTTSANASRNAKDFLTLFRISILHSIHSLVSLRQPAANAVGSGDSVHYQCTKLSAQKQAIFKKIV